MSIINNQNTILYMPTAVNNKHVINVKTSIKCKLFTAVKENKLIY